MSLLSRLNLLVAAQCLLGQFALSAQETPPCFMVTDSGDVISLHHLCGHTNLEDTQEPSVQARELFESGFELGRARRYQDALNAFSEAIRLEPMYAEAYAGRAVIKVELREFQQAIDDYTRAANIVRRRGEFERAERLDDAIAKTERLSLLELIENERGDHSH